MEYTLEVFDDQSSWIRGNSKNYDELLEKSKGYLKQGYSITIHADEEE